MKRYAYFISYTGTQGRTEVSLGNTELVTDSPITGYGRIASIQRQIEKERKIGNVIILYFCLLREEEA